MTEEQLKNTIADILSDDAIHGFNATGKELADAIVEVIQQAGYVQLDPDQSVPCNLPAPCVGYKDTFNEGERHGYARGIRDMLNSNFRRIRRE